MIAGAHMHTMQLGGAHMHTLGPFAAGLTQLILLAIVLGTAVAVGLVILWRRYAAAVLAPAPGGTMHMHTEQGSVHIR